MVGMEEMMIICKIILIMFWEDIFGWKIFDIKVLLSWSFYMVILII